MNMFSDRTGRVVLVPDAGAPVALSVQGWPGAQALKAAITSINLGAAGNVQFVHTLRDFVYVYVFGERMSEITVGGLAFPNDCQARTPGGIENLWRFYQRNRVASRGAPLGLAVGATMMFEGFLTGFTVALNDPQFGLAQWALRFAFHPPER
jgi:hypothetical protein